MAFNMMEPRQQHLGIGDRKAHVNRQRLTVFIFHFGLGQRRPTVDAPMHRLGTAMQMTVGDDLRQ